MHHDVSKADSCTSYKPTTLSISDISTTWYYSYMFMLYLSQPRNQKQLDDILLLELTALSWLPFITYKSQFLLVKYKFCLVAEVAARQDFEDIHVRDHLF